MVRCLGLPAALGDLSVPATWRGYQGGTVTVWYGTGNATPPP